jgi:hypothetical protein
MMPFWSKKFSEVLSFFLSNFLGICVILDTFSRQTAFILPKMPAAGLEPLP